MPLALVVSMVEAFCCAIYCTMMIVNRNAIFGDKNFVMDEELMRRRLYV